MINETAPASWKNDNRYVKVASVNDAKIVNFQISGANSLGEHSAVKTDSPFGPTKYMSKYGNDGPLVAHDLMGSVYHLKGQVVANTMEYWTYVGGISGNENINIGSNYTYSVQAASGVTYSWTSVNNRFSIVSGNGTHLVNISPTQSGTDILRLTITGTSGQSKIQYFPIVIAPACLDGTYTSSTQTNAPLNTVNAVSAGQIITDILCPSASSIQWTHTSGSAPYWIWNNNNVLIQMPSSGNISFKVDAKTANGQTITTRNITFYNFGSFKIFPNPTSGLVNIDINPKLAFDAEIISLEAPSLKTYIRMEGESTFDISHLPNGEYWLKIYHEGKVINEQRIILKK
ncbi:T9SS type A sorting domain-containing protein [Belliella kenyensis]|uniref:T9SS type A sorting domain-containing protein n=1 Tax=Belliella kenyensis TaxID=1472724 RepID=A0ABV8EQH1_9BACT|nr:T9SS type A sorting domain-containing protein [Belliella kenyensis]MCH7403809.1 T9SS type A sorting domain-containing protein [Belliella kenyensis]